MSQRSRRLVQKLEMQKRLPHEIDALMVELIEQEGWSQGDIVRLTGLSRQEVSRRVTRTGRKMVWVVQSNGKAQRVAVGIER